MSKIYYEDYLYGFDLKEIDNKILTANCLDIEKNLMNLFPVEEGAFYDIVGSKTTQIYNKYNLFTCPYPELVRLYKHLVEKITPLLDDRSYMIQSWMNIYRKNEYINWHNHWESQYDVWHGFYCVQVGNSHTLYDIPGAPTHIKIDSKEGLLVVGKSKGDKHSSSIWLDDTEPRITLAFDIIPCDVLLSQNNHINHYLPFKERST